VLPACGATACLAGSTRDAAGVSTVRYANPGTAPLDALLAVATSTPTGFFAITADAHAVAANGRCASPIALADGAALADQRPVDAREAPRGCAASLGPSLYYAVRVGAGEELTVGATTTAPVGAPRLALLDGCDAAACMATAASPEFPRYATVTWTNPGAAPRDLIVAVGMGYGASVDQRVALTASVRRPAYRLDPIAAACDDMTVSTAVPVETNFLGSTVWPLHDLPFAFTYFGEPMRSWAALGGHLQLFGASGGDAQDGQAFALPTPSATARIVAPLWSRLQFDWRAGIRSRVVEGPRRRLSVQWTDARPYSAEGVAGAPVTFQAWLLASGEIEFHYCAVTPEASALASIGIQGGAPVVGVSHAFRRAGAVATGAGLRFTPAGP
jgi:hypothetical protein